MSYAPLEALAESHLNLSQGRLLVNLTAGPMSQSQAAIQLGVSTVAITGYVDKLEKRELLTREPDPYDRRKHLVTLTPKGFKLAASIIRP